MEGRSGRLSSARVAVRDVLGNRNIRQLVAAWTIGIAGDWTFLVPLLVVAYNEAGAFGVGALGLARMVPATVVALFVTIPPRIAPERALVAINILRTLGAVVAAVAVMTGTPLFVIGAAAGLVAAAGALVRPTQAAMLPSMARTPDELIAANVGAGTGEAIGTFAGPAIGGLIQVVAGPAAALWASAVVAADQAAPTRPPILAGVGALLERPTAGLIIVGLACQVFVRGLLTTLIVVASIELLGLGESGVGGLNAAIGAGGFIGAIAALGLAGRPRLAGVYALALACWGLPIALVGVLPLPGVAVFAMAALGISNAILDISAFSVLQRALSNEQRAAVFAFLEGVIGLGVAAGGIAAPQLVELLGVRGALLVTGAILPIAAVATWPRVSRVDTESVVPTRQLELLRGVPMFGLLPMTMIERLAGAMTPERIPAGQELMREGESGDRFYIVSSGRFAVSAGGRSLGEAGSGDGVGEIALLRRVPRTATVTAVEDGEVYALDGEEFLAAISEHLGNSQAADIVISTRLARSERAAVG